MNNSLTLSQFVSNSNYLTNETSLIFSPGNYGLESELIVENVHSFSMFARPSFSSKTVIVCAGHNARFEFRNVSIVTVSGLEFVGCFENHVVSVGRFQLADSSFFGNGQAIVSGTVLTIVESTANLDRVAIVSIVDIRLSALQENCTATYYAISTIDRVIGISLNRSIIRITQSWFEGNNVVLGGVIYDEFGSDITISNTTFVNNSASDLFDVCFNCDLNHCNITGDITDGIVYAHSHGSTVEIYNSKFVENIGPGVVIIGDNCNMIISHAKFINEYSGRLATVHVTNTHLVISHSTFTNNSGEALEARDTNMSIRHSEFFGNYGYATVYVFQGLITSIDHSKFINNRHALYAEYTNTVSITHSEFVDNTATDSLVRLDGVMMTVSQNEFINNRANDVVYMPYYNTAENLTNNVFIDNSAAYEVYINPVCRPGLSLSLGSPRCIQCGIEI